MTTSVVSLDEHLALRRNGCTCTFELGDTQHVLHRIKAHDCPTHGLPVTQDRYTVRFVEGYDLGEFAHAQIAARLALCINTFRWPIWEREQVPRNEVWAGFNPDNRGEPMPVITIAPGSPFAADLAQAQLRGELSAWLASIVADTEKRLFG